MKPKSRKFWIRCSRYDRWELKANVVVILESKPNERKAEFVKRCAQFCRDRAAAIAPISLRVCRRDGTIIEERTYPRSADPRRSKG